MRGLIGRTQLSEAGLLSVTLIESPRVRCVQMKRQLEASIKQEEATWGAVMTVETAEDMLTGKARGTGFGGVSKPAESSCIRFFLTVKESLEARRRQLRAKLEATAADWEDRKRQMHVRITILPVLRLLVSHSCVECDRCSAVVAVPRAPHYPVHV